MTCFPVCTGGAGLQACSPDLWANSGGPSSRTRRERIHSTVLGDDDGPVRCPRVLRVAIDYGRYTSSSFTATPGARLL